MQVLAYAAGAVRWSVPVERAEVSVGYYYLWPSHGPAVSAAR